MRRTVISVFILSVFLPAWSATAQEKRADDFAALAPFIDDQTLAVARVDLTKFDLTAFQKQIIEPQLRTDPERAQPWPWNSTNFGNWPINCAASGGKVYVVVSLAPLPGIQNVGAMGMSVPSVFAVVPGAKGAGTRRDRSTAKAASATSELPVPRRWCSLCGRNCTASP